MFSVYVLYMFDGFVIPSQSLTVSPAALIDGNPVLNFADFRKQKCEKPLTMIDKLCYWQLTTIIMFVLPLVPHRGKAPPIVYVLCFICFKIDFIHSLVFIHPYKNSLCLQIQNNVWYLSVCSLAWHNHPSLCYNTYHCILLSWVLIVRARLQ
jgi:hypothetical protein